MEYEAVKPVQQLIHYYENGGTYRDYRNCYNYQKQMEILNSTHPRLCEISSLISAFDFYENIPLEHRSNESSDDILHYAIELYKEKCERIYAEEEREEYMNELGLDTDDDSSDEPDSDYDE